MNALIKEIKFFIIRKNCVKVETFCNNSFEGIFDSLDEESKISTIRLHNSYHGKNITISLPLDSIYMIEDSEVKIPDREFTILETTRIRSNFKKFKDGGILSDRFGREASEKDVD